MGLRVIAPALAAAILLTACASTAGRAGDSTAAEREVRVQIAAWQAAAARRDAPALAALYGDDAVVLYPGLPELRGRAAVERLWANIFRAATVTIAPGRVEVNPARDVAVEYGTYEVRALGTEPRVTDRGRYAFVWRKAGGVWRAWVDITTSDARPSPPGS